MTENNNVVLSQKVSELVATLKQAQAEVEALLSEKVTEASIQTFRKFEKLLRKTSETEEFSKVFLITKEEKQYLRVVLRDVTKTYNKFQEHAGIRSW
ncbi:MAG: hypothetical protein WAQ98_29795 [Blastocatellia bacterium]